MGLTIGTLHVRRSIFIEARPERVWQEFSTFERLAGWFGRGHQLHELECAQDGQVDISIEHVAGLEAGADGRNHLVGSVLVCEPARELSFETRWQHNEDPLPILWTIRLSSVYDGTLVEIFQHGIERFGSSAARMLEGLEQGWTVHHLVALRAVVTPDDAQGRS